MRPVSSRGVRSHTRNGRTVRGYRQGYQSRAQQAADAGLGVLIAAGTLTSVLLDLAGLVVNITGLLIAALFGLRWTYRSRHALRWRKLKRAFRPTRRHTGKHPARRRHDNEPWRSRPVLGGPRSRDGIYNRSGNGEWRKVA